MEGDQKFHQRWEFRRKEVDRDSSSDDNRSNASGPPAVDLVLLDNDEASDHPEPQKRDDEKKTKSSKKKQVSKGCQQVKKENKRKRNSTEAEGIKMLKGLKTFADSLIQELAVSRENMCARMRDEMRELVARGMQRKEQVIKKKNVQRRKGAVKPKNTKSNSGAADDPKASGEAVKNDHRVLEVASRTETRVPETARINPEQVVVSSSYPTLPRNHYLPSNDHTSVITNLNPGIHIGSFYQKNAGLFGQSFPQQPARIPFTVPLSQGTGNGSSISSLTSFIGQDNVGPGMNGIMRFPRENAAPTDQMFSYSNLTCKEDGQEVEDGHVCSTNLRNQR